MIRDLPIVHIVDDDEAVRLSMTLSLRSTGYEVIEYQSSAEFLTASEQAMTGCVVVDQGLPNLSGIELVDALRAEGRILPVILISGAGKLPAPEIARRPNIIGCLAKPFRLTRLRELIDLSDTVTDEIIAD